MWRPLAAPALCLWLLAGSAAVSGRAAGRSEEERTPPARPTIHVTDARQLLEALGPARVIELAPGTYDLSTAADVRGPHLRWKKVSDGLAPVIHDVTGLTFRGPDEGEARILVEPRDARVLTLRAVRDVTLENLELGHTEMPESCGAGVLGIEDCARCVVRRTVLFGSGTEGLTLREVRNSRFEDVTIRDTSNRWMSMHGSDGVLFDRCHFVGIPGDESPILLDDSWGVELVDGELVDERRLFPESAPNPWIGRYLEIDASSAVRFRNTSIVDGVTGRRSPVDEVVPPSATSRLSPTPYQAPGWKLVRGDFDIGGWRPVTLVLDDGRSLDLARERVDESGALVEGLIPTSVRVRQKEVGGPVLVQWQDQCACLGAYATGYYRVLGPSPGDPVLLSDEISLSGHAGALSASNASFELDSMDGVVTLREQRFSHYGDEHPAPLRHRKDLGDEVYYVADLETVEVRRWRVQADRAVPIARTLYYRVEDGDTPSDVAEGLSPFFELEIRTDWIETGPDGELPLAGQWVRIDVPIKAGAAGGSGPRSPGDRAVPTLELLDRPDPGLNGSNVHFDAPNERVGSWTEVAARCASAGSLSREESPGASEPVERCEMIKLSVSDGYTLYSELWRTPVAIGRFSTWATDSSLYARRDDTGEVWLLFTVSVATGVGSTGQGSEVDSRFGPIVKFPVWIDGTGNFNANFLFLRRGTELIEIDSLSWGRELELPVGHAIWKGIDIDPATFQISTSVWQDGDGNCCPSGGSLSVQLKLVGRRLVIEEQTYHPPDDPPDGKDQ